MVMLVLLLPLLLLLLLLLAMGCGHTGMETVENFCGVLLLCVLVMMRVVGRGL